MILVVSRFNFSSDTDMACTGVKLMQGSSAAATGAERYKLAISDGRYWCTAMMATQLNELAKTNQIHNNTIMRLDDYLSNAVQGKKYAIQHSTLVALASSVHVFSLCCPCIGKYNSSESPPLQDNHHTVSDSD